MSPGMEYLICVQGQMYGPLVIKILELAGILVQDIGLYQIANAEEQETIQQEKS